MNEVNIAGLGEVVVDWVMEIPTYPRPDEKVDAISESIFAGGVTANYLVAIARLGGKCGFIGAVGEDNYGDFLINDFISEGVDVQCTFHKKGKKTPVNFIFVTEGEKTIIQSPYMKETRLNISDLNEDYISRAKVLHTTIIHQDLTEKAIKIAQNNDVKISIDLEPQVALRGWQELKEILLDSDVLIPNKEGAKIITKTTNIEEAAKILIKKGIPIVIITMGYEGALITTKKKQSKIPAFKVNKVIDTTGAGDAFNGAFSVAYWLKNLSLEDSCKYANAAAALKIQKLGARTGLPNEKELFEFLRNNNF